MVGKCSPPQPLGWLVPMFCLEGFIGAHSFYGEHALAYPQPRFSDTSGPEIKASPTILRNVVENYLGKAGTLLPPETPYGIPYPIIIIIIIKEHWDRTGWCLSLQREYGRSLPPESWVAPLASAKGATPVRVTTTSFDERMSNIEFHSNNVNRNGAFREGVASRRCPVDQQRRPGCHPATAEQRQKRLRWSKEDNKWLFECYIRSEPERQGYRTRLLDLWKACNINNELTTSPSRDWLIKYAKLRTRSG